MPQYPKVDESRSNEVLYVLRHPTVNPAGFATISLLPIVAAFVASISFGSREFNLYFLPVLLIILVSLVAFVKFKSPSEK